MHKKDVKSINKMLNTKTHNKSWVVNINKGCPSCLDSLNPRGTPEWSFNATQNKNKTVL